MFFDELYEYMDKCCIEYEINAKIAPILSFRVGGVANVIAYPDTIEKFCKIIKFVNGIYKFFILGKGTNCYFDECYDGIIVSTIKLVGLSLIKNGIVAKCGTSLTRCAVYAYKNELTGVEFLYGIPGSVGGGVYMNASAFSGMISDVVKECTVYDLNQNKIIVMSKKDLFFDIKHSIFMEEKLYVLDVTFSLNRGKANEIKQLMTKYMKKRIDTQPLDLPSAGSVFKRPKNAYASQLIDMLGMKGYRIGDAEVSTKHAGFIVNKGNATAKEVNLFIEKIKIEILKKYDINLEEEIIFVE